MPPTLIYFPPNIVKASYVEYVEQGAVVSWLDPIAIDNNGPSSGLNYRKGAKPITNLQKLYH